jgi:hypothetical protein
MIQISFPISPQLFLPPHTYAFWGARYTIWVYEIDKWKNRVEKNEIKILKKKKKKKSNKFIKKKKN